MKLAKEIALIVAGKHKSYDQRFKKRARRLV